MRLAMLTMCVPLMVLLLLATVIDVRQRRIPNWITAALVLTGLAQAASGWGTVGFGWSLAGAGLALALSLALVLCGVFGGGDLKMLVGIGAWLGPWGLGQVVLIAAVLAMVLSLAQCAAQGRLLALLANTLSVMHDLLTLRGLRGGARPALVSVGKPLPYALPVMLATVLLLAGSAALGR